MPVKRSEYLLRLLQPLIFFLFVLFTDLKTSRCARMYSRDLMTSHFILARLLGVKGELLQSACGYKAKLVSINLTLNSFS
jgi:hypothetical protein